MQPCPKSLLIAAFLLASLGLCAQEPDHSQELDLLARLSYESSPVVQREEVRHVCVAVSRDGDYQIVRSLLEGETQRLQGRMSHKQLQELKKLLESSEFRTLSGNHGGLIRQDAESFGAEIPLPDKQGEDGTQRIQWLNADGSSPFPSAVAKVVDWLKQFEPPNAKSFVYAKFSDVCPSGGLRLLQPTVAANHP